MTVFTFQHHVLCDLIEIWSCYLTILYAFSFFRILHCHEVSCLLSISHNVRCVCVSFITCFLAVLMFVVSLSGQ